MALSLAEKDILRILKQRGDIDKDDVIGVVFFLKQGDKAKENCEEMLMWLNENPNITRDDILRKQFEILDIWLPTKNDVNNE